MLVKDISAYGGSERLIEALASTGLHELYPPQALAIKAGLLRGRDSFVVAAPTASGKTLVAEMAALKLFFEGRGKTLYLVPLRALAREKYEELSKKYQKNGIRVAQSTGDYDRADPWLYHADFIISTNEKMDSLIRHHTPWLKDIGLVVADEVHLLGDRSRGPTLEVVLTCLRGTNPGLRLIALSATIPNATEIAEWLGARLVQSDWRPVPLREGVYCHDAIIFNDGTVTWVQRESDVDVVDLACQTIRDSGQALVFVNTRKATETVARKALAFVAGALSNQEKESLKKLSEQMVKGSLEPTHVCKRLAECVLNGVAFHHAGITSSQRRLIEDSFRSHKIKLVAATTTLAMGLNLPSRRVIVRDWLRYESGMGMLPIPVIEIKQMSGRAGRPGFDKYGEAVIVARNRTDEKHLFENYITGKPENINSQLANQSALRTHILASIAGGFARNRIGLMDFLGKTFFAYQKGSDYLSSITDDVLSFLETEEMTVSHDGGFMATRFGRRVSELYIDPLTGVIIRDALHQPKEKEVFPFLHMIARTSDMRVLSLKKRDFEEMLNIFHAHADRLLIPDEEKYPLEDTLSELKTACALMKWIEETPEDRIVGHFGIGPGDLRTLVELSEWLLYSAGEIARIFRLKEAEKILFLLRTRVLYGVKEELLPLVALRGIGRVRARNLFKSGYMSLKDVQETTAEELAKIPTIGKAIAEDIKSQVQSPVDAR